jgi:hypothetical protein
MPPSSFAVNISNQVKNSNLKEMNNNDYDIIGTVLNQNLRRE